MNRIVGCRRISSRIFLFLGNKILSPLPRSSHSQANPPKPSDLVSPICHLLKNGGKWSSLSSAYSSAELDDALVERIFLNLKEPVDAKGALLFFHWSSQCKSYQHSLKSYCLVIHILVRANLLTDAQALLESVINKNSNPESPTNIVAETLLRSHGDDVVPTPRVFDLLLQTYSKMRMVEQAFDACLYMGDHGFTPSLASFNKMLHVAQRSDWSGLAWKVFENMFVRRVYPNQDSIETMVNLMCKEGCLQRMLRLLDRIHGKRCAPGILVNMALVLRIFEEKRFAQGYILVRRMLQKNLIFDDIMSSLIIYAHCKIGKFHDAAMAYNDMVNRGCRPNAFVHTCFIGARCKENSVEEALQLVEEMHSIGLNPYDETYSYLIEGCARTGRLEESVSFCKKMMKEGFLPSLPAFSEMAVKLCDLGEVEKVDEILTALTEKGFAPNEEIYCQLIHGFGRIGKAQRILGLYYEMEHRGFVVGLPVYAALIRSLSDCGKMKDAKKFIKMMKGDAERAMC
ncbi:hypothetical protein HPP92_001141 [Vanilla planifolia]|uniref:Pentatricopeptide repeat-containing protein n=1 Tax=Vanilla planifolia TaxID=51239 RepID=A0A835VHP9_VANPL|nr:hypothetical protein HPP92_001141 [Vanilla planifolia]